MGKIIALVQARMGSTRFPKKVTMEIDEYPLIEILLKRLYNAKKIDQIILVTTDSFKDDELVKLVENMGVIVFRGSENDVLDRYYQGSRKYKASTIVRITGDCPLIDPELVDQIINEFESNNTDYTSNIIPPTYPDGLDVEVFSFGALKIAWEQATTKYDREHVTTYIRNNDSFLKHNVKNDIDYSKERWTVDEIDDFNFISKAIGHFLPNLNFTWRNVLDLKKTNPEYFLLNKNINRNEGAKLGMGQKLWKRAKKIIPGGNMLLSKRSEMFLPDQWPAYFSKAKGCRVWDLEGNEYIDMSLMGIGTNTLGYGHPEVDGAVREVIDKGNMSTLNCPEEVYLSEKLIELHPWANMVRLSRTGGEANAISIRIARAATGKDKVAFCGYHGWHDWYLSTNLDNESNLEHHLLPGLAPKGVPQDLKGTSLPFIYNDFESLEQLVLNNDIGVIKMEVSRSVPPKKGFLESVRTLATKNNIVLIFDECTSGFRETFGGLHKKYSVDPDIMILGKTLGNGYAINAIVGREEIMNAVQTTFISSTFWTERIGPVAALKTLEVMEKLESWKQITSIGENIKKKLQILANKYSLPIEITGLPALSSFSMLSKNWLKYKTLISQEMLRKGYLASNSVYVCIDHKDNIIYEYFEKLDSVFSMIADCENGQNIDELLRGPVCHTGFKRLN